MGGRPWETEDKGGSFARTMFRYYPQEVKLAFCIFARPETEWPQTEKWNKSMFQTFAGGRKIAYRTMSAKTLEADSDWADIVYIPGGNPYVLIEKLKAYDLEKLWDKKLIAGSSAGADLFCEKFVYLQEKTVGEGLGWVKASCIPHWRDKFEDYTYKDWDWAEETLQKEFPDLPVLCIPEGKFVELSVT
jgi:peptidase E